MKSIIYQDVKVKTDSTIKTGIETLDSFLSNEGGFVEGSAIFLTGTPGAGKTTFAVVLQRMLKQYKTALYSREMTASRVKVQMNRYSIKHANAFIADKEMCGTLDSFIEDLDEFLPKVVIIDSLQFIMKEDYPNQSAETSSFDIIQKLRAWTDKNNAVLIVVGHVNKDGEFEGRNTIQHMFDSHMEMIYNKKRGTRTISWAKNRNGAVGEILYYEFGEDSIEFFTLQQFEAIKNNKSLEDCVSEMIKTFISSLDKKNANYPAFKAEMREEFKKIYNYNIDLDLLEANLMCINSIKKLLTKYGF